MKKQNQVLTDQISGKIDINKVNDLRNNWQRTLPIYLGDLFTRVTSTSIERFDTYKLNIEDVNEILAMNNSNGGENVKFISVIMGMCKPEDVSPQEFVNNFTKPTGNLFIPIIMLELNNPYNEELVYYFTLVPQPTIFKLMDPPGITRKTDLQYLLEDQKLSPKVAELFIVKWQKLNTTELINAFDSLAPEATIDVDLGEDKTIQTFSENKMLRVRQYNYDGAETKAIFENMNDVHKHGIVNFYISMGAGLSVMDFHPFNFRPIIRIEKAPEDISRNGRMRSNDELLDFEIPASFYDTSRPCPPFCKPEIIA